MGWLRRASVPLLGLLMLWQKTSVTHSFGMPAVDTSDACSSCTDMVADLCTEWTNATNVQEILDSLEVQCKQNYRLEPLKQQLCEKVAEVWVQIPPGIFGGLETLDW